jgi:hypothetical protein
MAALRLQLETPAIGCRASWNDVLRRRLEWKPSRSSIAFRKDLVGIGRLPIDV